MDNNEITRETLLVSMTAGQLADFLAANPAEAGKDTQPEALAPTGSRRYVYGLKGIMELFGCSNVTAQRYKNGIIAPAVRQNGRKIVVDVEQALELFNEAKDM